jgi:hypothetical protein
MNGDSHSLRPEDMVFTIPLYPNPSQEEEEKHPITKTSPIKRSQNSAFERGLSNGHG